MIFKPCLLLLMVTKMKWCPGPESNRHAGKGEGFSYQLQLSLLHTQVASICGLDFLFTLSQSTAKLWLRQEPSSLYTFLGKSLLICHFKRGVKSQSRFLPSVEMTSSSPRFSSGLPPPWRAEVSPNLTPFTTGVSALCAQFTQVPCVYQFHHPGILWGRLTHQTMSLLHIYNL